MAPRLPSGAPASPAHPRVHAMGTHVGRAYLYQFTEQRPSLTSCRCPSRLSYVCPMRWPARVWAGGGEAWRGANCAALGRMRFDLHAETLNHSDRQASLQAAIKPEHRHRWLNHANNIFCSLILPTTQHAETS
ncbi:unnamed protein product [Sphagnum balticum]